MKFYIYRHVRPDTNQVFYIGKGSNVSTDTYQRVSSKERSIWWKRVVEKNDGKYVKEIIFECDTESEIFEKEKEFIALYGRKDLGLGTLVNMSNGGDGTTGIIITEKQKIDLSIRSSKMVINLETKETYRSAIIAAKENGVNYIQFVGYLNHKITNTTAFVYYSDYIKYGEEYCKTIFINQRWERIGSGKAVINIESRKQFKNAKEASIFYNIEPTYLRKKLNGSQKNNTNLRYA